MRELSALGAYEGGIDRALFTPADRAARALFVAWSRASGFEVVQDRAGNVFAQRAGRQDGPALLVGSHLDTVKTGGAYDGAYGVVAALCALEAIASDASETACAIEVVGWAGEEGSRFPLGCLGSGVFSGANPLAEVEALADERGTRFAAARDGSDGLLAGVAVRDGFPLPAAYLEIHVEQGPILERAGERLGVVTAIAGARRFRIALHGESGHAGTLPMTLRRDALCAAAELTLGLEARARELDECVATVGFLAVEPNQTNIVPGEAVLRVDMRSVDDARIDELERTLRAACVEIERSRGVAATIEPLEARKPVPMDAGLRALLHATVAEMGLHAIDVPSGAGHDAMCLGPVTPTAMLFVPSAGGRSHVGSEYTSPEDLELGAAVLARCILAVDRSIGLHARSRA